MAISPDVFEERRVRVENLNNPDSPLIFNLHLDNDKSACIIGLTEKETKVTIEKLTRALKRR